MPNKLMDLKKKIMLRKRNIIETMFDYLKNKMNLEHTRHRSPINAFVHILPQFISYCLKTNKPSVNYSFDLSLNYELIPSWGNMLLGYIIRHFVSKTSRQLIISAPKFYFFFLLLC
jgi:hypothetical protein